MDNKLNLPPFYVGQKVIYITGKRMPKNSIHTVTAVFKDWCGCWSVYINREIYDVPFQKDSTHAKCHQCLKEAKIIPGFDRWRGWFARSFRPLQQTSFPLIKIAEIREKERTKEEPVLLGEN